MNDTNRELGGALGVAVLGSILVSRYTSGLEGALRELPEAVKEAARSSLGGAIGITGPDSPLAAAARVAFTDAMSTAMTVGAVVALIAAVLVAVVMPEKIGTSEQQARHGGREVDAALAEASPL